MNVIDTPLSGVKLIQLDVYGDARGFFVERFNKERFLEHQLPTDFIQDNHSRSGPGVLRGLHLQHTPAQGKLIGVLRGAIWDVAVDARQGSPTFGQHFAVELNDTDGKLLWIPAGFAHGFYVTSEGLTDVMYKVDQPYEPKSEVSIAWDDPTLNIPWPIDHPPVVSERDQQAITWETYCQKPCFTLND